MDEFKEIRPYLDHEIPPVLDNLLANHEFTRSVAQFYYPRLSRLLLPILELIARKRLSSQLEGVDSVARMQDVLAVFLKRMRYKQ